MKRRILMFEEDEIKTVANNLHNAIIDLVDIPDCFAKNEVRRRLHDALNILYEEEIGGEDTNDS